MLFNVFSSSHCFTQGLPQGSVLAPLLFLFYINNLASSLNDDAVIALFANDVSIITAARKKEDAEVAAQSVLNSVLIWSQEWKLNLKADKSEICPFSTCSKVSTWQPALFVPTQKIRVNITPHLLCVILGLTFNAHLKKLTMSLSSSLRIIRATAHTSWGWRCSTLKMAFHALIRSKLDYAVPAWQPWTSTTNLPCLYCLFTGELVSTPLEALRLEDDVQSYHTCSNCLILKAREKALRSSDDQPKHVALAANIPQRLQNCCSLRRKANDLSTCLAPELEHRQTINPFSSPPWQLSSRRMEQISTSVLGITGRADKIDLKLRSSITFVASYQHHTIILIASSNKAPGTDKILMKLTILTSDFLSKPVSKALNNCITSHTFSENAKVATVVPIDKKTDDKYVMSNYKPVSLLNVFF